MNGYDLVWRLALAAGARACGMIPKFRRKVNRALRERTGWQIPTAPPEAGPCVMIHAVSLGEMNATRELVSQLQTARQDLRFLVTVTTDTGFARGVELYGKNPAVTLARYPLDFSDAVQRLLLRQRPSIVVLMELEVWPNFVRHCDRRGIPVVLVNGRLTESSFRSYRRAKLLIGTMFRKLSAVCAQDQAYAERFIALGARPEVVSVTGTMKFDTARVADHIAGDGELAGQVGLHPGAEPIWVCGSTGPGEEEIVLEVYRELLASYPALRLAIIPRHPERFDKVAAMIHAAGFDLVRRSQTRKNPPLAASQRSLSEAATPDPTSTPPVGPPLVVLGDTMGELAKFYSLATVVLVGRSLVDLGQRQRGSDMIEPAALAKPAIVGPWTHNFADAMRQLAQADAIEVVQTPAELRDRVAGVLASADSARSRGLRAQAVVRSQQGATTKHVSIILRQLEALLTVHRQR